SRRATPRAPRSRRLPWRARARPSPRPCASHPLRSRGAKLSPTKENALVSEELENGCRPTTPVGDNLVHDFAQGHAASFCALADRRDMRTLRDDDLGFVAVDNASVTMFLNPVVLQRPLAAADAGAFAQCVSAFYAGHPGGGFGVWSM